MKDNILLSIKTYLDIDGDGDEPIELQTQAKFGFLNGKYIIIYEESELTGYPETTTTIKICKDNVVVTRRGKFNMKLCYVNGEKTLSLYPTPYGDIAATIRTYDIDFKLSESDGGYLRVDYSLDGSNTDFCKNSLRVRVEPLCKSNG